MRPPTKWLWVGALAALLGLISIARGASLRGLTAGDEKRASLTLNSSSVLPRIQMDVLEFENFLINTDNGVELSPQVISALEKVQDRNLRSHRRLQETRVKKEKSLAAAADKKAIISTDPALHFSRSPFNGTDIISHPIALIRCSNQTLCVQPQLQLQKVYKVYYCKHVSHGVRFYFLIREALLLHPNIHLVDDPESADVIVYLPESAVWHKTECAAPAYKSKTIVLDETDGPNLFEPDNTDTTVPWLLYFKRSCKLFLLIFFWISVPRNKYIVFWSADVRRSNGVFKGYMGYLQNPNIFPMTYTIVEAYVRNMFNTMSHRDHEIVCTLRGSNSDPVRQRVRQWVEEYGKARGRKDVIAGQVNSASRLNFIFLFSFRVLFRVFILNFEEISMLIMF